MRSDAKISTALFLRSFFSNGPLDLEERLKSPLMLQAKLDTLRVLLNSEPASCCYDCSFVGDAF